MNAAAGDEEKNRAAIREVGIEVTTEMAERLIAEGAPDLHFMTMNNVRATQEVLHNLGMAPACARAGARHGSVAVTSLSYRDAPPRLRVEVSGWGCVIVCERLCGCVLAALAGVSVPLEDPKGSRISCESKIPQDVGESETPVELPR